MSRIKTRFKVLLVEQEPPLRQYEVAKKCGVSLPTISAIANGNWKTVSQDLLLTMCQIFDCQPGDLFIYEKEKPATNR